MDGFFRDLSSINFPLLIALVSVAALAVAALRRLTPHVIRRAPARLRHQILPLVTLARAIIYLILLSQIIPLLIVPTREKVLALLGASALAIGFAFKDYASSLTAGLVALFERTYRLGDRVQIGDTYGEVRALNLRSVKIVTPDDTAVYVPHSELWHAPVSNANDGARTMLCVAKVYLHPVHDGRQVRATLIDVALTSPYVDLDQPVTVIAFEEPWGTVYKLKAYVLDNRDEFHFITDLTLRAKAVLADLGVKPAHVPVVQRRA